MIHYGSTVMIEGQDGDLWKEQGRDASARFEKLRKVTPNSGAYWSEADYYEPHWPQSFWGMDNYERLSTIKQTYDPTGVFRVWNGIGGTRSELDAAVTLTSSLVAFLTLTFMY